jgi:hypothetical protein
MFCRPCIARIDDVAVITSDNIPNRRYVMIDLFSPDAEPLLGQRIEFSLLDRLKPEDMIIPVGDGREIRAYYPIDKVLFKQLQNIRRTVYFDRLPFLLKEIISQKKDIFNMIEMGMSDHYRLNLPLLF